MVPSLRALLSGVIDYAGTFPPAELSLEQAVKNYAAYKRGEQAWILSHFICPANRLGELEDYSALLFGDGEPFWSSAVTTHGGADLESFLRALQDDLQEVAAFTRRHGRAAAVAVLEARIPPGVVGNGEEAVLELVERSAEALAGTSSKIMPFYELQVVGQDPERVADALNAFQRFNKRWAGERLQPVAAKIRTGGATPEANPSVHQVAFFIEACRRLGLRFKATAGLHHPFYHRDVATGGTVHGFINLLVASVLAHVHVLGLQPTIEILRTKDSERFGFSESAISWDGHSASLSDIADTRAKLVVSFGSCSVAEPLEHLAKRGLA